MKPFPKMTHPLPKKTVAPPPLPKIGTSSSSKRKGVGGESDSKHHTQVIINTVTPEYVKSQVDSLLRDWNKDPEVAHMTEHRLRTEVIESIASGRMSQSNAAKACKQLLRLKAPLTRWFA